MNQGSDPLRMFGVGKTFKQPVGGAQNGKSHLWSVDQRRKPFVMAFARFAEEHSLNAATRTERFFDKPHALDANEAVFRRQAAAQSYAKLLEPAIVAASEKRGLACCSNIACGLAGSCHQVEGSKFSSLEANSR